MEEKPLQKTPLEAQHRELGARLVPFAGFLMPVQYSGIIEEHLAVRNAAGLFDVSHMGQLRVQGTDAFSFLQWLTTNDLAKLQPGQAQYSLLCKHDGTLIDDIIVYRKAENHFFICVNASNIEKDFQWIKKHAKEKGYPLNISNESAHYALLALQGPKAQTILQSLTTYDLASLKPFHFAESQVNDKETLIARTGYTGEDGFELYVSPADAPALWQKILQVGQPHGIKPVGLGARDTLRLEMKYSLYGQDIDEAHTAIEAGLGWVVKPDKGDFLGRSVLAAEKSAGPKRKLVGFKMRQRAIPRHGYKVFYNNEEIGEVTSGTHAPSLDYGIGCAYVGSRFAELSTGIEIDIRGKKIPAEVVKTPFYQGRKVV